MNAAIAPDGSPVDLYRRLPPGDDLAAIAPLVPRGATVLDLGCGAGRLAHPLAAAGCDVTAVDESAAMLAHVRGCRTVLCRIQNLDLRRTFEVVLLSANLVNTADDADREQLLDACRRHLAPQGVLLLQRIDPVWAATAQPFESERAGVHFSFGDVAVDASVLAATIRYRGADYDERQSFRARILDDATLDEALTRSGLQRERWLDDRWTWLSARLRDG